MTNHIVLFHKTRYENSTVLFSKLALSFTFCGIVNERPTARQYIFRYRSESFIIILIIIQINFITLASVHHFLVMRSRVQLFAFVVRV